MTQSNLTFTENYDIPEGYKKTEFGIIPENWQVNKLGDISTIYSGGTPNRKVNEYWDGSIPWVTTTLINGGEIKEAQEFITTKGYENSSAKWCEKDTILMAMYGQGKTRGKVGKLAFGATINQACAAIKLEDNYNVNYILSFLNSKYEAIRELSNSGGQENLSGSIVKSIPILIPSFKEQQKIATALSDTDALISELEKLIEKKQAIKTATMQQLLTGKTRLPEFALREDGMPKGYKDSELGRIPEDWEVVCLGDIGQALIGLTYSPNDTAEFGTLVLRSSNVQNGKLSFDNNVFVRMALPDRVIVKEGDILICVRNGSRQLIGKCALIDKKTEGSAFGAFMSVYRTKSYGFIFYQFQSNIIQNQINETMGATINQITNKDLNSFRIMQPLIAKEKNEIYETIKDLDKDINLDIKRLNKLISIKQGMMQELLTGKTRLV